jgi:sugar phosphate isomerase/epimerase
VTTRAISVNGYDYRGLTYQDIGARLRDLDVSYMELQYDMNNGQPLAEAGSILADYGVGLSCVYTSSQWAVVNAAQSERALAVIEECTMLAQAAKAPFVQIYPGPIMGRDRYAAVKLLGRRLERALGRAEEAGVTLIFENLFDIKAVDPRQEDVFRRPEDCLMLLETIGSPQLKLNFDPANFYIAGMEAWPYGYRALKEQIGYVHLKDTMRYAEYVHGPRSEHKVYSEPTGEYLMAPVGEGALNFEGFLAELVRDGYTGFVGLEALTPPAEMEASLRRSIGYLRARLGG